MNSQLFKSTEFYQKRYQNFSTIIIFPLVLLIMFLLSFLLWAKKEVTVEVTGTIEPTSIVATIQSTSDNTIIKNQLRSNKEVKKGDLLIQYSEKMESSQKESLQKQFDLLSRQETGLKTLEDSINQGTSLFQEENDEFGYQSTFTTYLAQYDSIGQGVNSSNRESSPQTNLGNETDTASSFEISGFPVQSETLSKTNKNHKMTSKRNSYKSIPLTLDSQYDTDLSSQREVLKAQYLKEAGQQLATVQIQKSEVEGKLNQANILLSNTTIKAPEDGIIHLNQSYENLSTVSTGKELAQIYPKIESTKEVFISYYVSSDYILKLKKGQSVRLTLDEVGNHNMMVLGKIESIDSSAIETEKGNIFRVKAKAKLTAQESRSLKYGFQGRVTSIIDKKSYFAYLKDKLFNQLN